MSETITEKWRCHECGTLHDFEDDAHTCCRPQVSKVYVCQDCGDDHREKSEAVACCCDDDATSEERQQQVPRPTTAQLEALGQLRLVP
jgi:hypothetical protein